jgi:hypothetical protein
MHLRQWQRQLYLQGQKPNLDYYGLTDSVCACMPDVDSLVKTLSHLIENPKEILLGKRARAFIEKSTIT